MGLHVPGNVCQWWLNWETPNQRCSLMPHRCEAFRSHFLLGGKRVSFHIQYIKFCFSQDIKKLQRAPLLLRGKSLTNNKVITLLETVNGLRLWETKQFEIQENTGPSKERCQGSISSTVQNTGGRDARATQVNKKNFAEMKQLQRPSVDHRESTAPWASGVTTGSSQVPHGLFSMDHTTQSLRKLGTGRRLAWRRGVAR